MQGRLEVEEFPSQCERNTVGQCLPVRATLSFSTSYGVIGLSSKPHHWAAKCRRFVSTYVCVCERLLAGASQPAEHLRAETSISLNFPPQQVLHRVGRSGKKAGWPYSAAVSKLLQKSRTYNSQSNANKTFALLQNYSQDVAFCLSQLQTSASLTAVDNAQVHLLP